MQEFEWIALNKVWGVTLAWEGANNSVKEKARDTEANLKPVERRALVTAPMSPWSQARQQKATQLDVGKSTSLPLCWRVLYVAA